MAPRAQVLVIDDEEVIRAGCRLALAREGYDVEVAEGGERGLELARARVFDVVLLDLRMPGIDGLEVLARLAALDPQVVVVVITGYATVESAVEAMRRGAYDFLPKPFEPDGLLAVVARAVERRRLGLENARLRREAEERGGAAALLGGSPAMLAVAERVRRAAADDGPVLVVGEPGTGKELVARCIHDRSARRAGPFGGADAQALGDELLERELFGFAQALPAGGVATTYGRLQLCHGGTFLLDEVSAVGPAVQWRLLELLERGEVSRTGSAQRVAVDVRLIAASTEDLAAAVRDGLFREELYFRLAVLPIHVPPLRERREDLPELARHFVAVHASRRRREVRGVTDEALEALAAYEWPGNVRELEMVIERAVILADGEQVGVPELLAYGLAAGGALPAPEGRLAEVERDEILRALERFRGHRGRAAAYLGINRKTLREKLARLGVRRE